MKGITNKDWKAVFWAIVAIGAVALICTAVIPTAKADVVDDVKKDMLGNETQQKEIWAAVGGILGWGGSLLQVIVIVSLVAVILGLILKIAYSSLRHDATKRQEGIESIITLFLAIFGTLFFSSLIFYVYKTF